MVKNIFKTFKQMKTDTLDDEDSNDDDATLEDCDNNSDKTVIAKSVRFAKTHPGGQFSYLKKRKFEVILIISIPKGSMCRIKDLDLDNRASSTHVTEMRESYTKFALLMFHPYREKEDIMMNGSYWKNDNEQLLWSKEEETVFLKQGSQTLHNIDNRMTLRSQVKRVCDPVSLKIS